MGEIDIQRAASPYLTTAEAAAYLRFRSTSGVRSAVARGELIPSLSGAGPRGGHLFLRQYLDRFLIERNTAALG